MIYLFQNKPNQAPITGSFFGVFDAALSNDFSRIEMLNIRQLNCFLKQILLVFESSGLSLKKMVLLTGFLTNGIRMCFIIFVRSKTNLSE
jgi:hypothetical protein